MKDSGLSAIQSMSMEKLSVVYTRLTIPPMSSDNIEAWFTAVDFWFIAGEIMPDK